MTLVLSTGPKTPILSLSLSHPTTTSGSELTIAGVSVLEGHLDFDAYRRQIQERVIDARKGPGGSKKYPTFSKHIVRKYGYYICEEDEDFSLNHHLRVHPNRFTDDASLVEIVSSIVHSPFAKNHSSWEVVFVLQATRTTMSAEDTEVVQQGYAMVARSSHSHLDGFGVMQMVKEACDESSRTRLDELVENAIFKISKYSPRITGNPLIHHMMSKRKSLTFTEWCKVVFNALQIVMATPWYIVELCLHTERCSLHGAKLDGQMLITLSDYVDLQLVKDISILYKCTINTVFFCCLGSALNKCDPSASHVRVAITLSVLPSFNQFSINGSAATFVDLPLQHENLEKRLEAYSRILTNSLSSPEPFIQFFFTNLVGNHLPLIISKAMFSAANYTVVSTNVNGPPFQLFQHSCPLIDVFCIPNNLQSAGRYHVLFVMWITR